MSLFSGPVSLTLPEPELLPLEDRQSCLGALAWRPGIRSRNAVRYMVARAWRANAKDADLAALKAAKRAEIIPPAIVAGAAADLHALLAPFFGGFSVLGGNWTLVTNVATGHSRRPDALAPQIAEALAGRLHCPYWQIFDDRYISGSSHPKAFAGLPPLTIRDCPIKSVVPVLVIDDVATSGWHMEEALMLLRASGVMAIGAAWIGGEVQ